LVEYESLAHPPPAQSEKSPRSVFRDAPLSTLFTILVIGVAVAMPSGLYVLLSNLDRAAGGVKPQVETDLVHQSRHAGKRQPGIGIQFEQAGRHRKSGVLSASRMALSLGKR
jgi:hypothetical protein